MALPPMLQIARMTTQEDMEQSKRQLLELEQERRDRAASLHQKIEDCEETLAALDKLEAAE